MGIKKYTAWKTDGIEDGEAKKRARSKLDHRLIALTIVITTAFG